jgi:hypothetical protein
MRILGGDLYFQKQHYYGNQSVMRRWHPFGTSPHNEVEKGYNRLTPIGGQLRVPSSTQLL